MTAFELVRNIFAIIGAVASIGGLGWKVWTWRRSGPRIEVIAVNTFPVYGNHVGDHHVTVTARNRGRAATTITSWGIAMPDDRSMVVLRPLAWSTRLPHRLESEAAAEFHVHAGEVRRGCAEQEVRLEELRPYVVLATGRRVYGDKVPLAA